MRVEEFAKEIRRLADELNTVVKTARDEKVEVELDLGADEKVLVTRIAFVQEF